MNICDGSFTGRTIHGNGVTAQALCDAGVAVYSDEQLDALLDDLEERKHDTV